MPPPDTSPSRNDPVSTQLSDRIEKLSYADLWVQDALRACGRHEAFLTVEVDMTRYRDLRQRLRMQGTMVGYPAIFVRAVALVLVRHPEFNELVVGRRRLRPSRVDVSLSVAGSAVIAPVLVIEDADRKPLVAIDREIAARAPEAKTKQERDLAWLRVWGWVVPFGWLRRALLRQVMNRLPSRRRAVGTFQVSCLPTVDLVVTHLFATPAILCVGQVRDRVVAVNGRPEVRPTVLLTCSLDHMVWDGMKSVQFLRALIKVLDSDAVAADITPVRGDDHDQVLEAGTRPEHH